MLLFDDGKKLEKAVGEEAALVIVGILERMSETQRNANATRGDVRETELRLQNDIKETELRLMGEIEHTRKEIKEVELRLMGEIEHTRKEIKEVELRLMSEIKQVKYDMLKWQIGGFVALSTIMAKGFGWLGF